MRYSKYLILFLAFYLPLKLIAQSSATETDITGLWKGTIYNDTTQKYYRYEIGISEEKGKLTGFSHTFFIVEDKEFYGVKKVKIKRAGDKIIIEDDGLIANNYPEKPPKGVRQINVLTLDTKDSIMTLSGPYSTTRTKLYSSLTGRVELKRKNDFWQSALVPHLKELGLVNDLSFVKKENDSINAATKETVAQNNTPEKISISENKNVGKAGKVTTDDIAKKESRKNEISKKDAAKSTVSAAPEKKQTNSNAEPAVSKKQVEPTPIAAKEIKLIPPAAEVAARLNIVQQTVYFNSDSLQLSLYDNGEVDGDTVSVLMNGKIIMAKEGLSTNAVSKTIYATQDSDSIELVMYAENLGSISPNTGLLVVHDGKSIYEIRFSGDLQKNAAIILKRRKKQ